MKRGEIWIAHLGHGIGSEQVGARPVLIIQNDLGNEHSPTVIVAVLTDVKKRYMPTHVMITRSEGMTKDSQVLLEQIRTIDKKRVDVKITTLSEAKMMMIDRALQVSLGLIPVEQLREVPSL